MHQAPERVKLTDSVTKIAAFVVGASSGVFLLFDIGAFYAIMMICFVVVYLLLPKRIGVFSSLTDVSSLRAAGPYALHWCLLLLILGCLAVVGICNLVTHKTKESVDVLQANSTKLNPEVELALPGATKANAYFALAMADRSISGAKQDKGGKTARAAGFRLYPLNEVIALSVNAVAESVAAKAGSIGVTAAILLFVFLAVQSMLLQERKTA